MSPTSGQGPQNRAERGAKARGMCCSLLKVGSWRSFAVTAAQDDQSEFSLKKSYRMNEPVYILGGGRTDFKRNLKKEGKTIRDLITESGRKAIDDAKIDPGEIQAGGGGQFQRRPVHQAAASRRVHSGDRSEAARHSDDAHRSGLRFRCAFGFARRAMDHGRILRCRPGGRRGTAKNDVVARWFRCSWAPRPIITSKSRNTAISCSRNCSAASRRFTSTNTARAKPTWRRWRGKTTRTQN